MQQVMQFLVMFVLDDILHFGTNGIGDGIFKPLEHENINFLKLEVKQLRFIVSLAME